MSAIILKEGNPGHSGKMVEIGWNTGARVPTRALKVDYSGGPPKHAWILGYASAFTKAKLSGAEQ
ncbi:hypothetical protein K435DRAFT_858421 [Dendrothele bispora CBS 962.96]|uniref:Uncharacterized protein n=1 Tax=Dendrothele bispora (strain CBS 962.96) TaxID=1314807 RepID=A0A4S8M499_DENBC|nr:hypothetical protein K435DRAFT_858421 [Dendrothele bispora CBS 962.96]